MKTPVIAKQTLGPRWPCLDPFLFCAYHKEIYPKANGKLGPDASLEGRDMGQDFSGKDGWNMYHGRTVPGFPSHPHRGFETVTIVEQGLVDHADSLGAAARYGQGDTQWLTTGFGIEHAEMFPLLDTEKQNPAELFQIWLNLPPEGKKAKANYQIFWNSKIPRVALSKGVEIKLIAGEMAGTKALPPPPDSWASVKGSDVTIGILKFKAGSSWTMPKADAALTRVLYFYEGESLKIAGDSVNAPSAVQLAPDADSVIEAGSDCSLLWLQGRPIAKPVVQYGPFVVNSEAELDKAFSDYRAGVFGKWPWPSNDPTHGHKPERFAKYPDGREERP